MESYTNGSPKLLIGVPSLVPYCPILGLGCGEVGGKGTVYQC